MNSSSNKLIQFIFFGNYFYAICAVALSLEASLQQGFPPNSILFYFLAFAATHVYYTKASLMTEFSIHKPNSRSKWYYEHKSFMQKTQIIFLMSIFICVTWFLKNNFNVVLNFSKFEWITLFIFPIVALFYYGIELKLFKRFNLRTIGWLKPFVIGFTWAGLTTVFPLFFHAIENKTHYLPGTLAIFLFLKNFMYITILCMLFDIKDYAMDYNAQLKTIVIKIGLRKTLFYLIIPLCFVGLTFFYLFAFTQHFSISRIVINTLPFILIMAVSYSLSSRRSIFYYLIVIDGLMLAKALCGIIAAVLF